MPRDLTNSLVGKQSKSLTSLVISSLSTVTLSGQGPCLRIILDDTYQSSGKQSNFRDITRAKSDDGRWEPKLSE